MKCLFAYSIICLVNIFSGQEEPAANTSGTLNELIQNAELPSRTAVAIARQDRQATMAKDNDVVKSEPLTGCHSLTSIDVNKSPETPQFRTSPWGPVKI